jgi:L-alanine-DL-glutamate epimerase-like enolase superfamily enzyme
MILKMKKLGFKTKIEDVNLNGATVYHLKIPLRETFTISLGKQDYYEGIIIELYSENYVGYGEGATIEQITGEIPDAIFDNALHILSNTDEKNFDSIESFLDCVNRSMYGNPVAKNAIDIAVHDLTGKIYKIPTVKMFGGSLREMPTSYTIPIDNVENNIKTLREYQRENIKIIKVKVGIDPKLDAERITGIAENLKQGQSFYADANQGYNLNNAIAIGNVLFKNGALFFEQPMERHNLAKLRALRQKVGIPIALDESISSPFDVINAILSESADIVNVKLTKSGGIRNAFKTLVTAQAYGIEAMVGCMLESKLGIAASLAVANSLKNVKYTDLDGFTFLSKQPFEDGIVYKNGFNKPVNNDGLAVKKIEKNWK